MKYNSSNKFKPEKRRRKGRGHMIIEKDATVVQESFQEIIDMYN